MLSYSQNLEEVEQEDKLKINRVPNDSSEESTEVFGGVSKLLSDKKFPQNVRVLRMMAEEVVRSLFMDHHFQKGDDLMKALDQLASESRTVKLWVEALMKPALVMMTYIRAEREDFNENDYNASNISHDDRIFMKQMEEGIHVAEGHYEMPLTFKVGTPELPDNKRMAFQRLDGLKSRFRRNPKFHSDYSAYINAMIKGGHAEEVPFFVNKEHRDYLRFLWWRNGNVEDQVVEFRMKMHLFGAVSSPGCANFALKQTVTDHVTDISTAQFIKNDFYVDDGFCSVPTPCEAVSLINESRSVCAMKSPYLHKFISNSKEVMSAIPPEDHVSGVQDIEIDCDALPTERALGVQWCAESGCFMFQIQLDSHQDKVVTRRTILSMVSSIFDPIGLLAPVILRGKAILQELCKDQYDWDTLVSDGIFKAWNAWKTDLKSFHDLRIPRCVKPHDFGNVVATELHHFSDASMTGYGQCSYLRLMNEHEQVHCSLIMGKARVAPVKSVTIPRLELTAALTSVKVGQFLTHELDLGEVQNFYWTDSRIVLGYISNDFCRFHVYVANRIQQIRDKTSPKQWHHVSSSDNPADCASKGLTVNKLLTSKWLSGPDFLWEKEIPSPNSTSEYFVAADDPEMKGKKSAVLACETDENSPPYSILQRLEYFSDWFRAKRAVAHCLNLKRKLRKSKQRDCESVAGSVQVKEIEQEEIVILKLVQEEAFGEELKVLQSLNQTGTFKNQKATVRNKFLKSVSALYRLDPFQDSNGILRA
ncbi:uncharacterized protein [Haliotis cracherodii]|uniref:uncharacterized protein n=1 Tax=Haliotis cracherodii TaxID=6455 RepID=UPI0039E91FDA